MKLPQIVNTLLYSIPAAFAWLFVTGQPSTAQMAAWDYAVDSFNDGYDSGVIGQFSKYEFYAIGIKQDGDNIVIALNANMPLTGVLDSAAQDGVIGWGDLFFNFSGDDFNTASANGKLLGIRFAENNNSGVASKGLGVYENVTATSVTSINNGFSSLSRYNAAVQAAGGTPSLADLSATSSYFDQTGSVQNVIGQGDFVSSISFLDTAQLSGLGLDFSQFGASGSQTIGFSFDRNALPTGDFIANIFAECANDGIAIQGKTESVPEPPEIFGSIAAVGIIFWGRRLRKRHQASSVDLA